jgi:PKD repeat protein
MMKRKVVLLIVLLMFSATLPAIRNAGADDASSVWISVSPGIYMPTHVDETFIVNVNIANVSNLQGFEFKLGYNTSNLEALEVAEGPFMKSFGTTLPFKLETNGTSGYVWVVVVIMGSTPAQGNGTLATITFKCTSVGECLFDLYDTMLVDSSALLIGHHVSDGYSDDKFVAHSASATPNTDSTPHTVSMEPGILLNANFMWLPSYPWIGETATFDASSSTPGSGTIISYEWDFGDGTQGSGQVVTHAYTAPGIYTVTLTVTDSSGEWNVKQKPIRVMSLHCDFNFDGVVDDTDLQLLALVYGSSGPPGWIPEDLNRDGRVGLADLVAFALCPNYQDSLPPITQISLAGTLGTNGWYRSDVTVTLTATDQGARRSGVDRTEYCFDGITWVTYTQPFDITTEGATTVYYRSIDKKGNLEQTKSQTIKIDKTPPNLTVTSPEAKNYFNTETLTINYAATDALSGLAVVNATLGYDPAVVYVSPQTTNIMVGDTFSVDVNVADVADLTGIELLLRWDNTLVEYISHSMTMPVETYPGGILHGPILVAVNEASQSQGYVHIAIAGTGMPFTGSGKALTITFKCINAGESILNFDSGISGLYDSIANIIPCTFIDGQINANAGPEEHDVAVTGVTTSSTKVTAGDPLVITVDVENQGTRTETFDVSVLYDSNVIATQTISMGMNTKQALDFTWDTTGMGMGAYQIEAKAAIVLGEVDTIDNTYVDGKVIVRIPVQSGQAFDLSTFKPGTYVLTVNAHDNAGNQATKSVTFLVVIHASVDIAPDSLNLGSKGNWITCYIELPAGYHVNEINAASIRLNGTIPVDPLAPRTIGDYDNDGIPDLMVKFSRDNVISYVLTHIDMTQLAKKGSMTTTLTITGNLNDGTPFQGSDTITIIIPKTGKNALIQI